MHTNHFLLVTLQLTLWSAEVISFRIFSFALLGRVLRIYAQH